MNIFPTSLLNTCNSSIVLKQIPTVLSFSPMIHLPATLLPLSLQLMDATTQTLQVIYWWFTLFSLESLCCVDYIPAGCQLYEPTLSPMSNEYCSPFVSTEVCVFSFQFLGFNCFIQIYSLIPQGALDIEANISVWLIAVCFYNM